MSYQNTNNITTNSFLKGLVKDNDVLLSNPETWSHARNLTNNSLKGNLGTLVSEPANFKCVSLPYDYIGSIFIESSDTYVIFTTDNVNCEIGIFDEKTCSYKKLINDSRLNFKKTNLIIGTSKRNYDCTDSVYWDDGLNPTRKLNINNIVYEIKEIRIEEGCKTIVYSDKIDIEALRLSKLTDTPKIKLSKSPNGGYLFNGSYQVTIAYTVNQIRVTDYFTPSNIQSLFTHNNLESGLIVELSNLDLDYDEYELVVLTQINNLPNAVKIGNYSTKQTRISIDNLNPTLPVIPIENIPLQTPNYEKSDSIYEINDYLLRVGIYTKTDFNYQPLANNIITKWVALQVPSDYYYNGGNLTSYLRGENYIFFIRWVYNDGKKSASYLIPNTVTKPKNWDKINSAKITSNIKYNLEQGVVIAEGLMGYQESTEKYPDDKPQIWEDLCGKNIVLHKFPEDNLVPRSSDNGKFINILGVKFENIKPPVDLEGNVINSIVGYEILRGSREGNKTIIAKGLINNVAQYDIPNNITNRKGLYPNYPFNDLREDPFLSKNRVKGGCEGKGYSPLGDYRKDIFTFHSPDTQFKNPFLSAYKLKLESEDYGTVTGNFEPVFKHPKHKLLRDFALFTAGVVGIGAGLLAIKGSKSTTIENKRTFDPQIVGPGASSLPSITNPLTGEYISGPLIGKGKSTTNSGGIMQNSKELAVANAPFIFTFFLSQSMEEAIRFIKLMLPYEQFAYQYNSHGFYNNHRPIDKNNIFDIENANYLDPYLQEFTEEFRVNNLFRARNVILKLKQEVDNPQIEDNTRQTIGNLQLWDNPTQPFNTNTSAYYVSLIQDLKSQYGQLEGIIQIPISQGIYKTEDKTILYNSDVYFGGDVYINRYTEKNTMFYFNDWLFDYPDGHPYDYNLSNNIPYSRYWINTQDYDVTRLTQPLIKTATGGLVGNALGSLFDSTDSNLGSIVGNIVGSAAGALISLNDFNNAVLPNDYAHLDRRSSDCNSKISFGINKAYFYLFNNGVRDFFVESEINLAHRDYEEESIVSRHYDYKTYTDLKTLFRSDIIKAGNNYKYDYSLSSSKMFTNLLTWGFTLPKDYNPLVSKNCYSYFPNRIIYSLPQTTENKKDSWLVFLNENYRNFSSKINSLKATKGTGLIIYFENDSPIIFQGVDQLQTQGGIKITIGDGGLFQQPAQNLTNSDRQFQYGSCQNKYSVISIPYGVLSISQNQGKIFIFSQNLEDITRIGNKYWFAEYLPSFLLKDFPDYDYKDNPIIGVGTITGYDNTYEILYFTKVDYKLKDEYLGYVSYVGNNVFIYNNIKFNLGDSKYFENASFTISYDIKNRIFLSYHDWIPQAMLPSKNHLLTIKDKSIWVHNSRCDKFSNFYNQDYPVEIEFITSKGQDVTTIRNIEYILESYIYKNGCKDLFHVLDDNFDKAVVYNSEQCSGLLKLELKPKNNPFIVNKYPLVKNDYVITLYSKEENKYRFNQFWDVIKDRGEFTNAEFNMWITKPNGYDKELNDEALNYKKASIQRKKFRHLSNKVWLRKTISDNKQLVIKLINVKKSNSFR